VASISVNPAVSDPYIVKNLKVKIPHSQTKAQPTEKKEKIWAIDFDGTLCKSRYPNIGEPNMELIQALQWAKLNGVKLILWTCRTGPALDEAIKWCEERGLFFDAVNENLDSVKQRFGNNPRKIFAHLYIDDQAFPWWGNGEKGDLCKLQQR